MFDIKIGTLIPAESALTMIPQLNAVGFESYELNFNDCCALANGSEGDLKEYGKRVLDVLDGRKISALGIYANTIEDENTRRAVENLIANAEHFDCDRVGTFAGGHPALSVRETIPDFVKVFTPLIELAESKGVRIGLENCGDGWDRGSSNIAFCPEAWELIFNEISSDALGLEWEPCHAVMQLMDPIQQVRRWGSKIVHVHGKDATVAHDVIREYGLRGIHAYAWNRTPGFGDTNWADICTVLIQCGFKGSIDIEGYHDPVHYDDMEWTSQLTSLEYLKRCRGGINFFDGPTEYRGYQGKRMK